MNGTRRALLVGLCLLVLSPGLPAQQPAPATPALTDEEMAVFLQKAKIVSQRRASKGVTDSVRATLSDGRITHDAHIQNVDDSKMVFEAGAKSELNFKDTYRYNIGGYRLARLLGLKNVPMSVERSVNGKEAAVTWWVDDYMFDEGDRLKQKSILGPNPDRTSKQTAVMRVWDELIQNMDRNQGNMVWTTDWTLWMIDHTRSFRLGKDLRKPDQLSRCDRVLLDNLRALTLESATQAVGDIMTKAEMQAVLARRDKIVKHFDERIARLGDNVVLFSMN